MNEAAVVLLGTRGTIAVSGAEFAVYGGATSCVLVRLGGELIFLDAGTGLVSAVPRLGAGGGHFSILLSHSHIDHIMGLAAFPPLFDKRWRADIYSAERQGLTCREQIEKLMSFPLWPVSPDAFHENTRFLPINGSFSIGNAEVRTMEGGHPGGSTVYRLSCGGKSLVYCTDFEHTDELSARVAEFASGCDLLIYDAQYSAEEFEDRRGWGHSTWDEGVDMAGRCGAKRLVLFHHSPSRTDAELAELQASIGNEYVIFGKCGEEIVL
jgi:phosphoribosyl 1,2-cyclic phosphodiesterase